MTINRTALITAAALAVGALGLPASVLAQQKTKDDARQDQTSPPTAPSQQDVANGSKAEKRQAADTQAIRELLSRATDDAARGDGFTDFAKLFIVSPAPNAIGSPGTRGDGSPQGVQEDAATKTPDQAKSLKERASQFQQDWKIKTGQDTHVDSSKLDQRVAQLRKDWKEKYSQDFQVGEGAVVYADISSRDVSAGEARPASSKTGGGSPADRETGAQRTTADEPSGNANTPSADSSPDSSNAAAGAIDTAPGTGTAQDAARQAVDHMSSGNGERVALNVREYQGAEPVNVQLVRAHSGRYQFAQPTPFDRQKLADKLAKHLGMVGDDKANWPADVNVAYRLVTQHVLMAVVETTGSNQRTAQAAQPAVAGAEIDQSK